MVDAAAGKGVRARASAGGASARRPLRPAAALAALLTVLIPVLLAGCGSSGDDLASRSAAAILAASRTAARDASAVRVDSHLYASAVKAKGRAGTKLRAASTIELQLSGDSGRARLVLLGSASEAIRLGSTLYVKSSPAFYRRLSRRTGVHVASGTWLKTSATELSELTALTEPGGELMLLLRNPTLSLTKGRTTTIDGRRAIELKTKGKLYDGAIYIAATGTPYPLMIVKHGRETGQITFTGWNDPATLSAPAGAVELQSLEHHGGS